MQDPLTNPISVGVEEAARMIGIGRTNMFSLIANGSVKSSRLGGRRVVLVSSLRQLVGETGERDNVTQR